jgi:predicted membrane protein
MIGRNERGAGNLKGILWLAAFALLIFCMWKTVPHFMNKYELEDLMNTEARFMSYGQRTEADVRNAIFGKVQDLEIPANRDDIKINKNQRRVKISLHYTVEIALPFYTWMKRFEIEVDNQGV